MEELIKTIVKEVREDFQIPPYFSDDALGRIINEGKAYFQRLNPFADLASDEVYRTLLKNYANYAFHHKLSDFRENYAEDILSWQLETPVESEGTDETGTT